jgi:hypothetical protein
MTTGGLLAAAWNKQCPDGHGDLQRVEGALLSIVAAPPFPVRTIEREFGDPDVQATADHFPVDAYVCPVCGLVRLYAR